MIGSGKLPPVGEALTYKNMFALLNKDLKNVEVPSKLKSFGVSSETALVRRYMLLFTLESA